MTGRVSLWILLGGMLFLVIALAVFGVFVQKVVTVTVQGRLHPLESDHSDYMTIILADSKLAHVRYDSVSGDGSVLYLFPLTESTNFSSLPFQLTWQAPMATSCYYIHVISCDGTRTSHPLHKRGGLLSLQEDYTVNIYKKTRTIQE